jgi:predicted site-specific integrase-resolvase
MTENVDVPDTSGRNGLWNGKAAKYVGRSVRSLQTWDRDGVLHPAWRSATNRRFYPKAQLDLFLGRRREAVVSTRVIAYCRVSSQAQKPDLTNQRRTLESFCAARRLTGIEWIDEVGGGLNFACQKFCEIMDAVERREVTTLAIAHHLDAARQANRTMRALYQRRISRRERTNRGDLRQRHRGSVSALVHAAAAR